MYSKEELRTWFASIKEPSNKALANKLKEQNKRYYLKQPESLREILNQGKRDS